MKSVYDIFAERGFVEQVTDEVKIRQALSDDHVTCYIGFDPTATSLHIEAWCRSWRWSICSSTDTGRLS